MLDVRIGSSNALFALRLPARCPRSGKPKPLCTNRTASPPRRVSEPLAFRSLRAKEFPIPSVQMGHYSVSRGACLR